MNAKIKELAEQCYHRYSEHNIDLQKFAELIVRECAYFSMVATDDHYDVEALYKHFGIKE